MSSAPIDSHLAVYNAILNQFCSFNIKVIHFVSYYAASSLTLLSMFVFREGIRNFDTDRCQ